NMGAPIYSTPVVANGTMLVGTQTHLYAINAGGKPAGSEAAAPAVKAVEAAAKKTVPAKSKK
ncbi:MAG: PQQ-binding-like beta-propeller repeat protein, partial [Verrucomicrobiota bacterium]